MTKAFSIKVSVVMLVHWLCLMLRHYNNFRGCPEHCGGVEMMAQKVFYSSLHSGFRHRQNLRYIFDYPTSCDLIYFCAKSPMVI